MEWQDGEKHDPVKVLDKFATYIRPRKNKRIARHRFKQRKQGTTESFDHFVKDLKLLLLDCEYADPDDMLIDAIIAGVREQRVQERLLDKGEDLTLAKAIEIPQQFEMSQRQMMIVRDEDAQVSTMAARPKHNAYNKNVHSKTQPMAGQQSQAANKPANTCFRCGRHPQHAWNQGKCPAIGAVCSHCRKPNHWAAACRSRGVSVVHADPAEDQPPEEDALGINVMQEENQIQMVASDKWVVAIDVLGQKV